MTVFYSAKTGGFYDNGWRSEYDQSGTWPADVVELTEAERQKYQLGQPPAGYQLSADDDGRPTWVQLPLDPVADRRFTAKRRIDAAAGNARARHVSAGQLVEEEYHLALKQTNEWRAGGSPADNVPPAIQDWADAANMTTEEAASDIEETAANWQAVLLHIRQVRLTGKAAVDGAEDQGIVSDMETVAEPYISQLNQMRPA